MTSPKIDRPHGGICVSCRNSGWVELQVRGYLACNAASARPDAEDVGEFLVVDFCNQYEREGVASNL